MATSIFSDISTADTININQCTVLVKTRILSLFDSGRTSFSSSLERTSNVVSAFSGVFDDVRQPQKGFPMSCPII